VPDTTSKPPLSVGRLEKAVMAYATSHGVAYGRVRQWVSFMILSGALERAARTSIGAQFVIKGAVALELRFRTKARVTNDMDVVALCDEKDLVLALERALSADYQGFTFSIKRQTRTIGEQGIRVLVVLTYLGSPWATVQIDLTRPELTPVETDHLQPLSLVHFGFNEPPELPCLSLRYHIAQKLHAMTGLGPGGKENDRYRDPIDLLLLQELVEDYTELKEACVETFRIRAKHKWPPTIKLPESWQAPFTRIASEIGLEITNLDVATDVLQQLVHKINRAT
jgi:hypothetical protein